MTGRRKRVLVVVEADPGTSSRALEALRMSVGVAVAENDVRVLLTGDSGQFLDPGGAGLPGGARAVGLIEALERLGAEVIRDGDPAEHIGAADATVRWTECQETDRRRVLLLRTGAPPPDGGDDEVRLLLSGSPGDAEAPDLDAVVDAILAHKPVVVW